MSFKERVPKGPSRTTNTTDSKFTIRSTFATAIVKHYGGHFETTNFKGKSTAVVKLYGIERRSVFSTEGSFGNPEWELPLSSSIR